MKLTSETKLLAVMGAIVALGVGFLTFSNRLTGAAEPTPAPPATPPPMDKVRFDNLLKQTRHIKGNPNARFTVIEFADFQCPNCRRTHHRYLKDFGKSIDVRFGFHHFPLEKPHLFAVSAAIAAELGEKQGKFWETYEALFRDPEKDLDQPYIDAAVAKVGIPASIYEAAKSDTDLANFVSADQQLGRDLGVDQTPTFFIYDAKTQVVTVAPGTTKLLTVLKGVPGVPTPEPSAPPTK